MDASIDSIASTAQRICIYPNITKVDPTKFNVNEDLDALSKLLNTQRQLSPKSPDVCVSCSSDEEECCLDVEERSDIQFIELINEMKFDDEESFMHQENEGKRSEETDEEDEEEQVAGNEAVAVADSDLRSTLENLMRLFAPRSLVRSKEVQTDMVLIEKGTCGYIAVSRVNQMLVYFLRCYYCAEKYPIGCWQKFISHVNTVHNVVEKMEADADPKVTTPIAPADQPTSNQTKVCILQNVVLPRLTAPTALPAAVNQPDTANVNNTLHDNASTVAKSTIEQVLTAAECGTKFETYNSNLEWDEMWDSGSDAEGTSEVKSCNPNMDHCYSQKLTAACPLPTVALNQNGVEMSKKEQDSNSCEIRFGQTDSNIVIDSAAVSQPNTANVNNTLHDNASTVAKLTIEQVLTAAKCGTKWETYNSNFKWDEVWDSGSDAEGTSEVKSCSPNMDHCYSQELTAPLPTVALDQNGVEMSKKEQDSNSYQIRFGQTDSNIVMDSAAVNQPDTGNVNNTLHDNASTVAKLTTEQILPVAECGTKCETYNSNFKWDEVWDSGSDAEGTSEVKSCSPNMDHCYSQELPAPLPTVALNQNGVGMSKKKQDSNSCEIRFGQTDSNIVMDLLELLTSFPVLWCSRTMSAVAYDNALEKLYKILNIRWELNLTAASFQHSLEKIKAWYRSTVVYTNICNSPNGYTGKYKEYFRKCTEFLPVFDCQTAVLLCNICDKKYHDEASLQVHKFQVHAVGQLPYECGVCGSRFWHVDGLGGHLVWHKKTYPLPKPLIFLTDKKKKLMNCEKCPRIFYEKAALDVHLTEHAIDERPYSCELCDERFSLLRDYRAHSKDSHNLPIHKCEVCGQGFSKGYNFNDHMKVHRRQFDYLCDICGRLFVRQRNFKQHMQGVHRNLAHCAICNCDFKGQSMLHKHRLLFHLVREGEVEEIKSFTNPLRYRALALRRKYERVYDSPTKRYRIRCPYCPKTYYSYHALHKHTLRIHDQTIKDSNKRTKRRKVGSAVSDLKCINEDEANPSVIEDNASSAMAVNSVPSEVTTTVVDSTSSKATAMAVETPSAVTTALSMPELLFAKEETIQATTELKQLNTENFKIEDERLFDVPEEAEFEYVLDAAAIEHEIL